ncbi:unnamed protein product [Paramecium sonneborni]|uniref:Ubiquitin-like protease family profile domain-containing protein n=1 Tax=Paramecium sonneborni TaxID=65129 RepID=A0A8S1RNG3_9CILI|nr:unnamed protein product [Paramecium sonneborni]
MVEKFLQSQQFYQKMFEVQVIKKSKEQKKQQFQLIEINQDTLNTFQQQQTNKIQKKKISKKQYEITTSNEQQFAQLETLEFQKEIIKSGNQQNINVRNIRSLSTNGVKPEQNNAQSINIKQKTKKIEFRLIHQITKNNQLFEAFIQHGFDVIDVLNNNEYEKLLIFTNILFYYNKNQQSFEKEFSSKEQYQNKMRGKLYHTTYDDNQNPKFIIQEGEFLIDIYKKSFLLDGQGIEYQGKSSQLKNQGEFKRGVYVQRIPQYQNKPQYKSYSVEPRRIKILEIVDGQTIIINNKNQNEKKNIWCKYNQQFSERDLMILDQQMWVNSSMIDCYASYLNQISQEVYFQQNQVQRQQINRIYFAPSSLITNFGHNYNIQQATEIFQQHFLELQEIRFSIQTIYSKIGFPINQRKHWYFLLFDLKQKNVEIFNSLSSTLKSHQPLIKFLSDLLMLENPQISISNNSGQQNDGYSCGYHVCQFMKTCQEAQFSNNINYQYNENQIKNILRDLIKDGNK